MFTNLNKAIFYFLLFPLFLFNIYIFFLATPSYKVSTSFVLKDLSSNSTQNNSLLSFMNGSGGNSQDIYIIETIIKSPTIAKFVSEKFDLDSFYSSSKTDISKRLSFNNHPFEDYLELYRSNIKFSYNDEKGIVDFNFNHTDNDNILKISEFIIRKSSEMFNLLNQRKSEKELLFITTQLSSKLSELKALETSILEYQNKYKIVDPELQIQNNLNVLNNLKLERLNALIVLKTERRNYGKKSKKLLNIKTKLSVLDGEIKKINDSLFKTGINDSSDLNVAIIVFNELKNEYLLKKDLYSKGIIQMELSRLDTLKSSKYIEVISEPFKPYEIFYPKKINFLITSLILFFFLYYIILFIINIIKEH